MPRLSEPMREALDAKDLAPMSQDDPETLRALRDTLLMQVAGVEACMALLMGASVTKAMTMLRRRSAGREAIGMKEGEGNG